MKTKTIVFYLLTLILFLYPLLFGYTSWFLLDQKLAILWVICLISAINYSDLKQHSNKKYIKLFFSTFLLILFWLTKDLLISKSEIVFFYSHKKTFNEIQKEDFENQHSDHIQKLDSENYFYYDYKVFKNKSITAIGIKGILDNTDGFLYWNGKDVLPSSFFDGNLTFTEKIEDNWYKFSTR